MIDSRLILAVDGGATKTTLVIQTDYGKKLYEKTSTGSNYQTIGAERVQQVLTDLMIDAFQLLNFQKIYIAAFAIAGIDTEHDLSIVKDIVNNCLSNMPFTVNTCIVENDVHSMFIGLSEGNPAAIVLSGTGSIAYATDGKGKVVRSGGFGHRASDEGSGYWIGLEIIRAVVRYEDGRSKKSTILKELLYKKLQVTSLDEVLAWLYRPEYRNAQVASISSIISDATRMGDEVAIEIATNAAKELALLCNAVLNKINYKKGPFTIYLNGGILQHHPIIKELFIQFTAEKFPMVEVKLCSKPPIEYIIKRALLELNK